MAKKISAKSGKISNKIEDVSVISDNEIVVSKKKVTNNLLQALKESEKYGADGDEENGDEENGDEENGDEGNEDEEKFFIETILIIGDMLQVARDKVMLLLKSPLNTSEKEKLKNSLIENFDTLESIPSLIKFFEDNELLKSLSLEAVLNLISLNLNENELKNLIRIADADYQRDEAVNSVLEGSNNKIIFSNNITNKIVKLKKLESDYFGIVFDVKDYILLKNIELSEELIKKIEILAEYGVNLSIRDFVNLNKFEIDKTIVNKLKKLKGKTIISFDDLYTIQSMDINRDFTKKINSLNEFGLRWLSIKDLLMIQKLTKNDIEKLEYINKKGGESSDIDGLDFVLKLEISEIDKIIGDIKSLGLDVTYGNFEVFYKIPEEVLKYCIENNVNEVSDIEKVKAMYSISNRKNMRDYINRKNEYLGENRTLSEEKYIKYFGGKGKFGKYEIKQGNIGLCYLYSCLEMLKKMNGFAELVQSNLIEEEDNYLVRFPFNIGSWTKVRKEEIDNIYEIKDEEGKIRKMNINSESDYLGFKILEIAYIKNAMIKRKLGKKEGEGKENNPLDVLITGKALNIIEGGDMIKTLQELLSEKNVTKGKIGSSNLTYSSFERLKKIHAPECILDNTKERIEKRNNRMDTLFNLHGTGFISIELSSDPSFSSIGSRMEKIEGKKDTTFLVSDVKIIDKSGEEIPTESLDDVKDVVIDGRGKRRVRIFASHAYSVEKCYIDKNGEKRMRVVNPWHTDIKFDLSLDQCAKLFNWDFGVINIDKLFKQKN